MIDEEKDILVPFILKCNLLDAFANGWGTDDGDIV